MAKKTTTTKRSTKKAGTKKASAKKPDTARTRKGAKPKLSQMDAAVRVLQARKKPMTCKDMVGRNFRDSRAVLRYAFNPTLEAGFSNVDIGGILSNVANKFLLEGFFSVERTWRNVTAVRNVSDFKTVTSYRLVGKDQYEQVAPGGELKHGTLGEERCAQLA